MLDFIPAKIRKDIYNALTAINLIVGPVLGALVLFGVIADGQAQQILGIAAQVMSALGFILASKNVDLTGGKHVAGGSIESESSSN